MLCLLEAAICISSRREPRRDEEGRMGEPRRDEEGGWENLGEMRRGRMGEPRRDEEGGDGRT